MDRGGIETMLMNFYRNMDHDKIQFDFLCNKPDPGDYDEEIKSMGGRVFVSPGFKSFRKYLKFMTNLFKEHPEYRIVHTHNGALMLYALLSAKKNRIPCRIAHAHATAVPAGNSAWFKKIILPYIKYNATNYWGCGNAAGEFYFGKERWSKEHEFIHNAINVENFTFNEKIRNEIREQYGFGDKYIVGHVGRLSVEKNQKLLLDVFAEVHKMNPKTHLVIIGTGYLEEPLKQQVKDLGLEDAVTFTGMLTNVNEWYSVFDVFVMTSPKEGLPVVAVEAQAADLPCVITDTITREVNITNNVRYVGLNDDPKIWAKTILEAKKQTRTNRLKDLQDAGYDIRLEAKRMQELYLKLYSDIQEGK